MRRPPQSLPSTFFELTSDQFSRLPHRILGPMILAARTAPLPTRGRYPCPAPRRPTRRLSILPRGFSTVLRPGIARRIWEATVVLPIRCCPVYRHYFHLSPRRARAARQLHDTMAETIRCEHVNRDEPTWILACRPAMPIALPWRFRDHFIRHPRGASGASARRPARHGPPARRP